MLIVQQGPSVEQKLAGIEEILRAASVLDAEAGTQGGQWGVTPVTFGMSPAGPTGFSLQSPIQDAMVCASSSAVTISPYQSLTLQSPAPLVPPPTADPLSELVDQEEPLVDTMLPFFGHPDEALAHNAARVYVRRLYRAYDLRRCVCVCVCLLCVHVRSFFSHRLFPRSLTVDGSVRFDVALTRGFVLAEWTFTALPSSFLHSYAPGADDTTASASYTELQVGYVGLTSYSHVDACPTV